MMKINKAKVIITLVLIATIGSFLFTESVFAESGGVVQINPAVKPAGSGGGGGGSDCSPTSDDSNYLIACTGASWIYYKAVAETEQDSVAFGAIYTDLLIFPVGGGMPDIGESVDIPKECSNHHKDNDPNKELDGGFWHYGINGKGIPYNGRGRFQNNLANLNLYELDPGSWGHWATLGYNLVSGVIENNKLEKLTGLSLGHSIKDNSGKVIYESQKTSTDVTDDFRRACMASEDITDKSVCNSVPTGTYLFCSWGASDYYGRSIATADSSTSDTGVASKESETQKESAKVDRHVDGNVQQI